jgi:hypothetical protein
MMEYPILIERFTGNQSVIVVCEKCHAEFDDWDPGEGDPYDLCSKHGNATLGECGGQLVFKYLEGETCDGCGKLEFSMPLHTQAHGRRVRACSRVCQLQAEYAASLKETA